MNSDNDGYLDFKELVIALGMTCSTDTTQRLTLLYLLHLPPLLPMADLQTTVISGNFITFPFVSARILFFSPFNTQHIDVKRFK